MKINQPLKSHYIIAIIFASGIIYLCALQWLIPEGAFFSGDSGLKAMLSQNLAKGNLEFNLDFPDSPWIKSLWNDGLFPYQEPYVYNLGGKYFITFPFTFSLTTALFYKVFGYRGLYFIPIFATIVIWFSFYRVCLKLGLSLISTLIGLFILIFASNLPIYSAMYSEQSISVCLAFLGFVLVIPSKGSQNIAFWAAFWAGVLSGLAVWFRPEQIFLVVFIDLLSLCALLSLRYKSLFKKLVFIKKFTDYIGKYGGVLILTSTLSLILYGLTNLLIYKNFLGVHAIQVIGQQSILERIMVALGNFQMMTIGYYSFFVYVPIAIFPLAYLLLNWINPTHFQLDLDWPIYYLFSLAFLIGVSFLVPAGAGGKQWGPRFLLLLVPIVILFFTRQFDYLVNYQININKFVRQCGFVLVSVLIVIGIVQNLFYGAGFLSNVYAQIKPAVEELHSRSEPVIAISDQFIGQVLQPAVNSNIVFFQVKNEDQLAKLTESLVQINQERFIYICYSFDCKLFNKEANQMQIERDGTEYIVQVNSFEEFGKYYILGIRVNRNN